jgi:hypothetical protein
MQPGLHPVLKGSIQIVNLSVFRKTCEEIRSENEGLLIHSEGCLFLVKTLAKDVELGTEIKIFLYQKKRVLADFFKDVIFLEKLASLGDIFHHLNELNTDM